jgi:hypothetical protein
VIDISTPTEQLAGHDDPPIEVEERSRQEPAEERHWGYAEGTRH